MKIPAFRFRPDETCGYRASDCRSTQGIKGLQSTCAISATREGVFVGKAPEKTPSREAHEPGASISLDRTVDQAGQLCGGPKLPRALEEENAKLKKLLAERMLDAVALRELLSKNGRASRQSRLGRASAGNHGVGTAGLLDHGSELEDDPLSLQPPSGGGVRDRQRTSPTSGGVSATVGYSSCGDGRACRRGSTGLYREEGLTVRKRRSRRKAVGTRAPIPAEARPNARWSLDFVHGQFANGRRYLSDYATGTTPFVDGGLTLRVGR